MLFQSIYPFPQGEEKNHFLSHSLSLNFGDSGPRAFLLVMCFDGACYAWYVDMQNQLEKEEKALPISHGQLG